MMAPLGCNIPGHVTGLYIFTVINLVILLNLTLAEANILVWDRNNHTVSKISHEVMARFGPELPLEGLWGHIAYTKPNNGCVTIEPPPSTSTQWIALIKRRDCDFDLKVLNAQKAGYIAAIVFNDKNNELVPMGGGSLAGRVRIPSVFIGLDDGQYLFQNFDRSVVYSVYMDDDAPFSIQLYLVPFAIVVAICFILMLVFVIVKWVRDFNKRRRSRLSKQHLKKIPIKKFKKGDDYDVCAICLDDYEEGDKLRILPCSHAYHQKCIDPWLTKNKKTCPICKRKVIPGRDEDSSDSEDESDSDADQRNSETQPLLPAQDLHRMPYRAGAGTFDNSGLPETVRAQLQQLAATSSSDDESDIDDDALTSSVHQSSVEVHSDYGHQQPAAAAFEVLDETSRNPGDGVAEEEGVVAVETAGRGTNVMEISEDHFPSEQNANSDALDPLGVARADDGQNAAEDDANNDVQVAPASGGRRKRQRRRNHNENV